MNPRTETSMPAQELQIRSSRAPVYVLALVGVVVALSASVLAGFVWQERTVRALESRANDYHRVALTKAADALASLSEADNRVLRAEESLAHGLALEREVRKDLVWREVRGLAYHASESIREIERLHDAWPDPAYHATVARLRELEQRFDTALELQEGLGEPLLRLLGPGTRELRLVLEQLRLLHDAGFDESVDEFHRRRTQAAQLLAVIVALALSLGAALVWRILRLIRADGARQRAVQEELAETLRMLERAQREGRVGLWRMDYPSGELKASEEAWQILGLPAELRTAEGFRAIMHPDDRGAFRDAVDRALRTGEQIAVRYRVIPPGGEMRHIGANAGATRVEGDRVMQLSGVVSDITSQVRTEQEVERYRSRLEQMVDERTAELRTLVQELEAFSYSVSHDLRGPLRGIDGFSQAALEEYGEVLDETGREYLRRVRSGVQRMGRLIDDLLSLSRVSRVELQREEVDLSALAEGVLGRLGRAANTPAVQWQVAGGMRTTADRGLAQLLLEKLLDNAWKFSARVAHPRIEFGSEERNGVTVYRIRDNGVGFDMRFADKLFGAFQRLHDQRDFEGTGIGLATAARIVQRHGGRIWAEGHPGAGATFYFTLPERTQARPTGENPAQP